MENKTKDKLNEILQQEIIDIEKLKKYIYRYGIPDDFEIRETVWKLLLGYYTPIQSEWEAIDINCLNQYEYYLQTLFPKASNERLDKNWFETWKTLDDCIDVYSMTNNVFEMNEDEAKIMEIIEKDIIRTPNGIPINRDLPVRHDLAFRRILFVISLVNGGISYVQGMNNLCDVFYTLFSRYATNPNYRMVEAQTFGCLLILVNALRKWFMSSFDYLPGGIQTAMEDVFKLVEKNDKSLYEQMLRIGLKQSMFMIEWISLLCCRQFHLTDTFRNWDLFFLDTKEWKPLKSLCCSMILLLRNNLIDKSFSEMFIVFQNVPLFNRQELMKKTLQILKNEKFSIDGTVDYSFTIMHDMRFISAKSELNELKNSYTNSLSASSSSTISELSENNNNNLNNNEKDILKDIMSNNIASMLNSNSPDYRSNSINNLNNSSRMNENIQLNESFQSYQTIQQESKSSTSTLSFTDLLTQSCDESIKENIPFSQSPNLNSSSSSCFQEKNEKDDDEDIDDFVILDLTPKIEMNPLPIKKTKGLFRNSKSLSFTPSNSNNSNSSNSSSFSLMNILSSQQKSVSPGTSCSPQNQLNIQTNSQVNSQINKKERSLSDAAHSKRRAFHIKLKSQNSDL